MVNCAPNRAETAVRSAKVVVVLDAVFKNRGEGWGVQGVRRSEGGIE